MSDRTPDYISRWLDGQLHRFDNPSQFLGTEPGASRKSWDETRVRWLIAASWPYYHCLSGDSVVLVNGHGPARMSSLSTDAYGIQVDSGGTLEPVAGVFQNGVRDVVKVECQGGFGVICTPDHQIRVARPLPWRKHGPSRTRLAREAPEEWVAAGDLQPGDVLKTYYGQNIWSSRRVTLPRPLNPGSAVTFPDELNEDLAWLLGLMATDCSIRPQYGRGMSAAIRWSADDPGVLAKLQEVVPRVFGKEPLVYRPERRCEIVELSSTPLVNWLRDVFGTERRRVPEAIFRSPREVVAAYLCGLFDGDGEVVRGRFTPGAPRFSNSEESLVRDVYVLLMNMGAPMSVQRQEPGQTTLTGGREAGWRTVYRMQALWAPDMDWSWLEFSHTYRRSGFPPWLDYQPALQGRCKAESGVAFCMVTEVTEAGQEEVWDVGIPTVHRFTANGIVVHNSTGNQSIPAVCATINNGREDFYADRFYLPETPRDLRQLERAGIPVFGIESRHQARDFDVLGTSISYAVLWLNFCKMLMLSGIPLRWRDREANAGEYPMLVAGGQACRGPGFMEPVADCIFLGEVEDEPGNGGLSQVNARIAQFKVEGSWHSERIGCYERLAREFNYLLFPRFVETLYRYEDRGLPELSKQVSGYRSLLPGMRMPFRARTVKNLDNIAPLTEAPLLYADPRMGAGDIEVGRGCDAWCSFCALGWNANPPRERSVEKSVEHAKVWQRNMGSVELSPFSPDFPMHRQKKRLLTALLENVNSSMDVTAMRIDDFIADDQYVLIQAHAGADGVTLGLEGNSQRMRDLVGKGTADKDVEEAVIRGIRAGFRKFKLFMICDLPGEESGDVMRIVDLGRRLAAIRAELGQPHVVFQMSFTPLLIEAQTPFQWFAPTPPDHTLIKVAEEFRELNIQFKIGTKAEVNKVSLFQLCQRASREIGEAITDVIEELDTACWGGVPKGENGTRVRLEAAMRRHGFRNGLADAFDERFAGDLFGWEYINMGVSFERMWDAYRQMLEFLEGTDAETYDSKFAGPAGGNEWVARCDQQCGGSSCGVCDGEDLKLRAARIKAEDADIDLAKVKVIDQSSVAFKIRVRFEVPLENRFVTRAHWVYAIRRAAYRAQHDMDWTTGIAKKTVQLASEACKHRDWACGIDYAEFGLTWRPPGGELYLFMQNMAAELKPWLELGGWQGFPPSASVRRDAALALWELEPPAGPDEVTARLRDFAAADYVKLVIRSDSAYFGSGIEEVNAKDLVTDLWLARDGHTHKLRMLISAKIGPYALYAALMGKPSWIEAAAKPARRLGIFTAGGDGDLLRPVCDGCGQMVLAGLLDEPYDQDFCPRCLDEATGHVTAALTSMSWPAGDGRSRV